MRGLRNNPRSRWVAFRAEGGFYRGATGLGALGQRPGAAGALGRGVRAAGRREGGPPGRMGGSAACSPPAPGPARSPSGLMVLSAGSFSLGLPLAMRAAMEKALAREESCGLGGAVYSMARGRPGGSVGSGPVVSPRRSSGGSVRPRPRSPPP